MQKWIRRVQSQIFDGFGWPNSFLISTLAREGKNGPTNSENSRYLDLYGRGVAIYDLVYDIGWEQGLVYGEWLCIGGLGSPEVFHERVVLPSCPFIWWHSFGIGL